MYHFGTESVLIREISALLLTLPTVVSLANSCAVHQKACAGIARPGMKVSRCGGRTVAESGLHKVNGRPVIERVGGVRMPQPMRAHVRGFVSHPCRFGCCTQNSSNSSTIKGFAAPRSEHWRVSSGTFLQFIQRIPRFRRQRDCPRSSVLPEYRDLAAVATCTEMPPA